MRGFFIFNAGLPNEQRIQNNILDQGEEAFLKMIARADVADVAAGGNFYIGLMTTDFAETDTLVDITEPTTTNGYARQAITRDAGGWPIIDQVNGKFRALSAIVNFVGTGGPFSTAIQRAFLCNVASGAVGKLFGVSGALSLPKTVVDGEVFPVRYELWLN